MDRIFIKRVKKLLRICVPGFGSKESIYMIFLLGLVVVRTWLSIWLAGVQGRIVEGIVNRDF